MRTAWRQNLAAMQHSARISRTSSEGAISSGSRSAVNTPARTSRGSAGARISLSGLPISPVRRRPSVPYRQGADELSSSPVSHRPAASPQPEQATFPPFQSGAIGEQVTRLVEELEGARAKAETFGGRASRAVEAAALALEPLLRLRDVTGGFPSDMAQMPWLPQLLMVFQNILRCAVSGDHLVRPPSCVASAADSGAGVGSSGGASSPSSSDTLCNFIRQQEILLSEARQKERAWAQEMVDLRRERDALQQRLAEAQRSAARSQSQQGDTKWLAQRVLELEREKSEWTLERKAAEEQVHDLVGLVRTAIEEPFPS